MGLHGNQEFHPGLGRSSFRGSRFQPFQVWSHSRGSFWGSFKGTMGFRAYGEDLNSRRP